MGGSTGHNRLVSARQIFTIVGNRAQTPEVVAPAYITANIAHIGKAPTKRSRKDAMPRTAAISNISLADLERMVQSRRKQLRKFERQRAKWQKKVDDVDRKIAALGGTAGRKG